MALLGDVVQRRPLVHRDVIGLVALDFVLRVVGAGVVRVALPVEVLLVHLGDVPAHVAGFGAEIAATVAEETGAKVARLGAPRIPVGYAPTLEAEARVSAAQVAAAAQKLAA